jgi:Predicted acetyltransferase, GNAT superfamily
MKFSIINTKKGDLGEILILNQLAIPAVSNVTLDEMANFLSFADYFKIIKIDNILVGFLIALYPGKDYQSLNYKWFEKRYKSFIYVDRIVIGSSYRKNGLGKAFYNDLAMFAKHKTDNITCEVNIRPKNKDSLIFHKKYGFCEVGTQVTENGEKEVSLMKYNFH